MKDLVNKMVMSGLGFAAMTKEKIEEIADKVIKETKLSEEEGKEALNEFVQKAEKAKDEFNKKVEEVSTKTWEKIKYSEKEEIEKLKNRITVLEEKIDALLKKDDNRDS